MPRLTPEQAAKVDADSEARVSRIRQEPTAYDYDALRILDLKAELKALRERAEQAEADRKVLAAEVLASRQWCTARTAISVMEPGARCGYGHPADPMMAGQKCPVCAAMEATDASGALTRGGGE